MGKTTQMHPFGVCGEFYGTAIGPKLTNAKEIHGVIHLARAWRHYDADRRGQIS
jgi:hypothetical protein